MKHIKEMEALLGRKGVKVKSVERGGKHYKVKVTDGKSEASMTVPTTPSDHRAMDNVIAQARRSLRLADTPAVAPVSLRLPTEAEKAEKVSLGGVDWNDVRTAPGTYEPSLPAAMSGGVMPKRATGKRAKAKAADGALNLTKHHVLLVRCFEAEPMRSAQWRWITRNRYRTLLGRTAERLHDVPDDVRPHMLSIAGEHLYHEFKKWDDIAVGCLGLAKRLDPLPDTVDAIAIGMIRLPSKGICILTREYNMQGGAEVENATTAEWVSAIQHDTYRHIRDELESVVRSQKW